MVKTQYVMMMVVVMVIGVDDSDGDDDLIDAINSEPHLITAQPKAMPTFNSWIREA